MRKALLLISVILLVSYLAYEVLIQWQEERLITKARGIQKGMRTEEVIEIMGKPKINGFIDSYRLPAGWDLVWRTDYEEIKMKYDKLLFFNYQIKRYEFPSFHEKNGHLHINIYFDPVEQTVVYVSRF